MNMYMPPLEDATADAMVYRHTRGEPGPSWRPVSVNTVVEWLTKDKTSEIFEWVDAHRNKVSRDAADKVEEYFDLTNLNCDAHVLDMVRCAAASGSQLMLLLRGTLPSNTTTPVGTEN